MKKIIILLTFCLTGCAHLNHEYDCPAEKGAGCKRLSSINEEYNQKKGLSYGEHNNEHIAVYLRELQDEYGNTHHPRKIMLRAK